MSSSLTRRKSVSTDNFPIFNDLWENIKGFFTVFPGKKRRNILHSQFKARSALIEASCIINLFSIKSLNFLAMMCFMIDSVGHFMIPNVFFSSKGRGVGRVSL